MGLSCGTSYCFFCFCSRTPGSRQSSPTSGSQQQDAPQATQPTLPSQPSLGQSKPKPYKESDPIEDIAPPVALIDPLESVQLEQLPFPPQREPVIGTPTSPSDFVMVTGASLQGQNAVSSQQGQSLQLTHQHQLALAMAASATTAAAAATSTTAIGIAIWIAI